MNAPIILGVSEGAAKYMGGYKTVVGMVNGLMEEMNISIPVALHLDHGTSFESCKNAIDAGFTSVMYDGSHDPIEKNVEVTKQVVDYAAKHDVSVEAEAGTVGGEEDGIIGGIQYASYEECEALVNAGIDSLAASLGSVHGHYIGEPKLGFDEMKQFSTGLNIPLVLHGGSGIPDEQIKKAIESGEAKININTELQVEFQKGLRKYFEENLDNEKGGYDPRKIFKKYSIPMLKAMVAKKIELFGNNNKG